MKAELDQTDRLNRILDSLETALQSGADFVSEQAPLVVQELLAWMWWESIIYAVSSLAIVIASLIGIKKMWRSAVDLAEDCDNPFPMVAVILLCGASVGFSISAFSNSKTAVKIAVAPRVVLLEYAKDLVKGRK